MSSRTDIGFLKRRRSTKRMRCPIVRWRKPLHERGRSWKWRHLLRQWWRWCAAEVWKELWSRWRSIILVTCDTKQNVRLLLIFEEYICNNYHWNLSEASTSFGDWKEQISDQVYIQSFQARRIAQKITQRFSCLQSALKRWLLNQSHPFPTDYKAVHLHVVTVVLNSDRGRGEIGNQ